MAELLEIPQGVESGPEPDEPSSVFLDHLSAETGALLLQLVEEYRSLQAEISSLEKDKKELMKQLSPLLDPIAADRVLDSSGRPIARREYRVSESVDETKLLEAGIPMKVIESCRVRKVSVYYRVVP